MSKHIEALDRLFATLDAEEGDTLSNAFPGPDDDRPDSLPRSWNHNNAGQFHLSMLGRCWAEGNTHYGVCNHLADQRSQTGLCADHLEQLRSK